MWMYWAEKKDLAKSLMKGAILNCEIVKDSKKNYDTRKYDNYLKIGSGFDTESCKLKNVNIVCSYVYHWQFSLGDLVILGRNLDQFEDFFKYLLDIIPKNVKLLSYVANLGFDYYFIKHRLSKYKITRHFEKKTKNPLVIEVDGKVVFRECIGLFGRSLDDIAKNFCKTKKMVGDLDYDLVRLSNTPMTNKEIKYCINDVKILSELGDYTFKHYYGDFRSLPLTAISELREDVKKEMGKNYYKIKNEIMSWMPDDEEEYWLFRNYLFKGGLCGSNSELINKHLKNVGHADFVSHYPAVMNHYQFPMGKAINCNTDEFMTEPLPYIAIIEFHNLQSRTTHSILSIHKAIDVSSTKLSKSDRSKTIIDNGRIWKSDKITFVVNDVEFRSICSAYTFGENTKIIKCWKFEKYGRLPYYLLNVLNNQYLNKVDLKNRGLDKTTDYVFAKNKVNGMFGMTCTALHMDKFDIDETGEIFSKKDSDGNKIKREYSDALKSVFLSPYWGMWITSYARALLIDFIVKFPKSIIQYDTDSIFYTTDNIESKNLLKYINKYNNDTVEFNRKLFSKKEFEDIGCFEQDSNLMTDFKGLGSKRYMFRQWNGKKEKFEIDTVVAGCRKGTIVDQFKFNYNIDPETNLDKLFDFFEDGMKIDKEHSKKLRSIYVPNYNGKLTKNIVAFDHLNKCEKITIEPCILLEPTEFNMGLTDEHVRFFMMIQSIFDNSPSERCKMLGNFDKIYDLSDDIEE